MCLGNQCVVPDLFAVVELDAWQIDGGSVLEETGDAKSFRVSQEGMVADTHTLVCERNG
jgi:hypothetical protein